MDQFGTLYIGGQSDLPSGRRPPPLAAGRKLGPDVPVWPMGPKFVFCKLEVDVICRPVARRSPAVGPVGPMAQVVLAGSRDSKYPLEPPNYGQCFPKSETRVWVWGL